MKYTVLIGRLLFAAIFIASAAGHFKPEMIAYAAAQGVPLASLAVPLSGIVALIGGLSILLGYKAKTGAWLVILFLIPVTFTMHAFWNKEAGMAQQMEMAFFMKNMSILGGALMITWFGSGPISLDRAINRKAHEKNLHQGSVKEESRKMPVTM